MSDIDISQILSSRYRTSIEADKYTDQLRQHLALDTKAQVARLALGRSLSLGPLPTDLVDSKGMDIPAMSLFSPENISAWVGVIVTHAEITNSDSIRSQDHFRIAIRAHWHRGAIALWQDWMACDQDYDRFIETLIRRSEMPTFTTNYSLIGPTPTDSTAKEENSDLVNLKADLAQLARALEELGIRGQIQKTIHGPRVTRYKILLTHLSDLPKLNRSMAQLGLAMNLGQAAASLTNGDEPKTVFIDIPRSRDKWQTVGVERLKDWVKNCPGDPNKLLLYAGVSVTGEDTWFDLANAPHLLVGGTTGSGKSVCLHSFLLSLILRLKPKAFQLALIDPKRVEFAPYSKLSNLYGGCIATEVAQAREMLMRLVEEMDARYSAFNQMQISNLHEARTAGHYFPSIVVFIEEMADLIMQDQHIEPLIARLAQKARAAGIHLVLATQRPDANTFTGLIRSNVPGRVALTVQKGTESNIILDEKGAENLLGSGDMLIRLSGDPPKRVHGVFVKSIHITQLIVGFLKT